MSGTIRGSEGESQGRGMEKEAQSSPAAAVRGAVQD